MWLVADLFERYTTSVAKTFLKIAAREADANRKALEDYRKTRQERAARVVASDRLNVQTRSSATPETASAEPAPAEVVAAATPLATAEPVAAEPVMAEPAAIEPIAAEPVDEAEAVAAPKPVVPEVPMGVRGDVVARWVETLADAAPGDIADLVETLRKDKKVRVAELQWIAVGMLDEEPTVRKKAEHLAALRERLGPSAGGGSAAAAEAPMSIHA